MMAPLSKSKDGRGAHREAMKLLREEGHKNNGNTNTSNIKIKTNDDGINGSNSSLLDGSFGEFIGNTVDPPTNRESNGHGNKFDLSIQNLRTQRVSSRNLTEGQVSPVAKPNPRPPSNRRNMLASSRQLSSKGLNNIDKSTWHGPSLDQTSGRLAPKQRGLRRNKSLDETTWAFGSPSRNNIPSIDKSSARNRRCNVASKEDEGRSENDLQTSDSKKTAVSRSRVGNRHQLTASRRAASLRNLYGNPNNGKNGRDEDDGFEEAPLNDAGGGTSKRALSRRSQSKRNLSSSSSHRMSRSNHSASGSGGTGMTVYSWHDGGVVATRSTRRNKARCRANATTSNHSSGQLNNSKSSLHSNGNTSDDSDGNLSFGSFGFDHAIELDKRDRDGVDDCENGEPNDTGPATRAGRKSTRSRSGSRSRSSSRGRNKTSSASRRNRPQRGSSRDDYVDTDSEGSAKARRTRRNRSRPNDNSGVEGRSSRSLSRDSDRDNTMKKTDCRQSEDKTTRARSNSRSRKHGDKNRNRGRRHHDDNATNIFDKDTDGNAAGRDAVKEPISTEADSSLKGMTTVDTGNRKDTSRTSKGLAISTKLSHTESNDIGGGAFGMSATSIEFDMLDWDAESAFTNSTDGNGNSNSNKNNQSTACFQLQFPSIET